jgi:hypothetical protein
MIHHNDIEALHRLLGVDIIPADVLAEVEMRWAMFISGGASGPLNTIALIDAIRFCGKAPAKKKVDEAKIDWRKVPSDGTVRVEAMFFGGWMPGMFLGFVEHGTLAVRLDDNPAIKECRPDMVRLAVTDNLSVDPDEPEPQPEPPFEQDPVDVESKKVAKKSPPKRNTKKSEPVDVPPNDPESSADYWASFWAKVESDSPIWIEDGDDILNGTFQGVAPKGEGDPYKLVVQVDGEETTRVVLADSVRYAGAAV